MPETALAREMPEQYATGCAAFRYLLLDVDERVLIPRPETEIVVEEALKVCREGTAIDVGTGSGAIALALATEGDFNRVIATDVSSDALAVARKNVARLDVRGVVELRAGSLLDPVRDVRADLIVSNPPYIAAGELSALPSSVRDWEPPAALLSGRDGLAHAAALIAAAPRVLVPGGWLVLEVDARRAHQVAALAAAGGDLGDVRVRQDLAGRDRIVLARRYG